MDTINTLSVCMQGMNKLRLGENYCRIYGIFMLPTEVEYG